MGNANPSFRKQNQHSTSPSHRHDEDEGWDNDVDADLVSLLEENARLRALVVRLSDIVLKNVVDQK
jgi:hypothetical protein